MIIHCGKITQHSYETGHVGIAPSGQISFTELPSEPFISSFFASVFNWKTYHFHDTSETAPVKRTGYLHDNRYLRPDASNLAAYLFMLKQGHVDTYNMILAGLSDLPCRSLSDFVLEPKEIKPDEYTVQLLWNAGQIATIIFFPANSQTARFGFISSRNCASAARPTVHDHNGRTRNRLAPVRYHLARVLNASSIRTNAGCSRNAVGCAG